MAPSPSPPPSTPDPDVPLAALGNAHRRRLREVWRSAGWPYQDVLEAELIAAGLLARERDAAGRDTLRVTDAGVAVIAHTLQRNRAARDAHEALVERVAREMQRAGRIVWRGLGLRARVGGEDDGQWVIAMPDVYSIRNTTVEGYLAPVAHEVKVRRADLLSDLRKPAKGEAYRWLAGECWYVIAEGIAMPEEIPPDYGVLVAPKAGAGGALEVARPAPTRAMRLPFPVWMSLARATPEPLADDEAQQALGGPADGT